MAKKKSGKKRGGSPYDVNTTPVTSWDEWFNRAGEMVVPMRKYEEDVQAYHRLYADPKDAPEITVRREFGMRHASDFYVDDPMFPSYLIRNTIKFSVITFAAMFVFALLMSFILAKVLQPESLFYGLFACGATEIPDKIPAALIWGLVGLIFVAVTTLVPFIFRRRSAIARLDEGAEALKGYLALIPPKYRNSFCLDALFDMRASYGVADFQNAINVLDKHISNNANVYIPFVALSDVPYSNSSTASFANKTYKVGEHDKSNKALPDDIDIHVNSGADDADKALNELIGLDDVKAQIRRLKNRIEFYDGGASDQLGGNHMIFLGPAGTGKTSAARIVTKLLYDFGYIQENRIIEVDGDYLKSPYQGQTGERVSAIVEYALGGVLFIDEAYLLYDQRGGAAAEATGVLLKAMEDKRDMLVIILAGYEDEMERLIASNEGFASRVRHKIRFRDYRVDELLDIFDYFLAKLSGTWSYEDGCREILEKLFDDERKSPGFGNARAVRNALDALLDVHADRSTKGDNPLGTQTTLTLGDVESYYEMRRRQIADEGHAFLASKHIDESIITLSDLKSRTRDGSADPDADLNKMIGLERVKDEMKQLDAQQEFYGGGQVTGHMAFVGPPGTGKTECARIITGKLYKMGYIRENRYLSVTGDFLRGSYIGHTGKRTEAVIEYARGMVLFIDEAYLLYSQKHDDSFGAEALGVLVEAMEKYRGDLVVIFAGYTTPMQELFDGNPGVASRVSTVLHFESYTPKQLCKIFQLMAYERDFKVDSRFWQPLANYIAPLTRAEDFGNARFARELCDKVIKAHVIRYGRGEVPEEGKMTLYVDDLLAVVG